MPQILLSSFQMTGECEYLEAGQVKAKSEAFGQLAEELSEYCKKWGIRQVKSLSSINKRVSCFRSN